MKLLTLCGSLQRRSVNKSLLQLAARRAPAHVDVHLGQWIGALPHFNSELASSEIVPIVDVWRSQVKGADAILISSPEYGHGVPGSLKNALDWLVGSGEMSGKRVAATCASQGDERGLLGLAALSQTLRAIDAELVWSSPTVVPRSSLDANGEIVSPAVEAELDRLLALLLPAS